MRFGIGATSGIRPKLLRIRFKPVNDLLIAFMPAPNLAHTRTSQPEPLPPPAVFLPNQGGEARHARKQQLHGREPSRFPPAPTLIKSRAPAMVARWAPLRGAAPGSAYL